MEELSGAKQRQTQLDHPHVIWFFFRIDAAALRCSESWKARRPAATQMELPRQEPLGRRAVGVRQKRRHFCAPALALGVLPWTLRSRAADVISGMPKEAAGIAMPGSPATVQAAGTVASNLSRFPF